MTKEILIVAEQFGGQFRKITYELLSEGRRLADKLDGSLTVLVMGHELKDDINVLGTYGADVIFSAMGPQFKNSNAEISAMMVVDLCKQRKPDIVLFGSTLQGRDTSARVSAKLQAGLVMECTALRLDGDRLVVKKSMFGGKVVTELMIEGSPKMVAVRPMVLDIEKKAGKGILEQLSPSVPETKVNVLETKIDTTPKLDLTEADVIV